MFIVEVSYIATRTWEVFRRHVLAMMRRPAFAGKPVHLNIAETVASGGRCDGNCPDPHLTPPGVEGIGAALPALLLRFNPAQHRLRLGDLLAPKQWYGPQSPSSEDKALSDRATKLLLAAIAIGLWANFLAPVLRSTPAKADAESILQSIDGHLSRIDRSTWSIYEDFAALARGRCGNAKIC
jgi:hypothetical protein